VEEGAVLLSIAVSGLRPDVHSLIIYAQVLIIYASECGTYTAVKALAFRQMSLKRSLFARKRIQQL